VVKGNRIEKKNIMKYEQLYQRLIKLLSAHMRQATRWQIRSYCQKKGWSWQVGLKSDLIFRRKGGAWRALRTIGSNPEERRYPPSISLTREHAFGPVNLMVD
jgi:hypothetical protein